MQEKREVKKIVRGNLVSRDLTALEWILRHGAVTSIQLARWIFSDSLAMARRRASVLIAHGLLRRERVAGVTVYLATSKGAAQVGSGLRPPRVSGLSAEIRHALQLVDLLETFLAISPRIAFDYTTERELRVAALRRRRDNPVATGRIPDGILHGHSGDIALENDRSTKSSALLKSLIKSYLPRLGDGAEFVSLAWVVATPAAAKRYRRIVNGFHAEDVVRVEVFGEVVR